MRVFSALVTVWEYSVCTEHPRELRAEDGKEMGQKWMREQSFKFPRGPFPRTPSVWWVVAVEERKGSWRGELSSGCIEYWLWARTIFPRELYHPIFQMGSLILEHVRPLQPAIGSSTSHACWLPSQPVLPASA